MVSWGLSFFLIGIIAGIFQFFGVEFYNSSAFKLLSGLTPGMRVHTAGAYNESIAAALWVYGTYTLPFVVWFTMKWVQNFRIPLLRSDRRNIFIACLIMLNGIQYIFESKVLILLDVPSLEHMSSSYVRFYRASVVGTLFVPPVLFSGTYLAITLIAFHIRAILRRQ